MSLELIRKIFVNPGVLKGSAWSLFMSMANRASEDGSGVWASIRTLSEDAGISERTGWDALAELLEKGVVIDTRKIHDWGRGHFTREYSIDIQAYIALSKAAFEDSVQDLRHNAKSAPRCEKRKSPVQNLQKPGAKSACKPVLISSSPNGSSDINQSAATQEPVHEVSKQVSQPPSSPSATDDGGRPPRASLLTDSEIQGLCEAEGLSPQTLLDYNHMHKKESSKLYIRTKAQFKSALTSTSENSLIVQFRTCEEEPCSICKRGSKSAPPVSLTPQGWTKGEYEVLRLMVDLGHTCMCDVRGSTKVCEAYPCIKLNG
jgi:hypothetical protein